MTTSAAQFAELLDRDRLVGRLAELVRTPSENPPGDEADSAALVRAYFESLGFEVSPHDAEPGRPSTVAGPTYANGTRLG